MRMETKGRERSRGRWGLSIEKWEEEYVDVWCLVSILFNPIMSESSGMED